MINREEDTASITGISIKEVAIIIATIDQFHKMAIETAGLHKKFKKIVDEAGEKNGIT